MLKKIMIDIFLEQRRNKKQFIIKVLLLIATVGIGFFFPFPYLFLLPLIVSESFSQKVRGDWRGIRNHIPHIQYILPLSRGLIRKYYIWRAGMVALFYSLINFIAYINIYIGVEFFYNGRYDSSIDAGLVSLFHYLLMSGIISLGVLFFALSSRINHYVKECQVERGTVTPAFLRMSRLVKGAAFFGWIVVVGTMVFCANDILGIHAVIDIGIENFNLPVLSTSGMYADIKPIYSIMLSLLLLLGWIIFPWVIYRCSKQLLVADYQ